MNRSGRLDQSELDFPAVFGQRWPCATDRLMSVTGGMLPIAAQGTNLVVVSTPSLAFCLRAGKAHEPVCVQAFRAQLPVERLHEPKLR